MGEKKSKAIFLNVERVWFEITKVDGCLCKHALAADFAVTKDQVGTVIVELKGSDVPHAVEQVLASAGFWREHQPNCASLAGLVVSRQRPRYSTSVQRAQTKFARSHKGPLHVVSSNREYVFEKVLSFKGP
ncbi:hypothetical protein AAE026_27135 [Bradyrhizobium sp. DN5]|uniref:hypothetical protein n=1 Tax=Bradyrhizobium sp. DN5 TaxID=3056950 RepID=UPI00352396F5